MPMHRFRITAAAALLALAATAHAADAGSAAPNPQDEQRRAIGLLASLDGQWRGPARTLARSGQFVELTQTERVGPMLDGTLRVMEGRGYGADGALQFNAFSVLSYDPPSRAYSLHAYAQGHEGHFPVQVTADGFAWEIAAGPARIRYTATITATRWVEVGERLVEGQPPMRIFEMALDRVGSTSTWPAAGAPGPN